MEFSLKRVGSYRPAVVVYEKPTRYTETVGSESGFSGPPFGRSLAITAIDDIHH